MQQRFLQRFTELILNGFSVADALAVMAVLFRPDMVKVMIEGCQKGLYFADTLEHLRFEQRIVYMIRANEQSGTLVKGLAKARDYSQLRLENQAQMQKKLRYPIFLFMMMILVLGGVYLFFIPQLDAFYESFNVGGDQTAINAIVLIIGLILGLVLTLVAFILMVLKLKSQRFKYWLFHLIGIRSLSQKIFAYYFASQWLMYIECGLSLKESLSTIKRFEKIPLILLIIDEFETCLERGETLEAIIHSSAYFTPYFKMVLGHALKIGCVDSELKQFATSELTYLNALLTTCFKVFQSVFLILIGSMIILLYLSILQPIFDLMQIL